MSLIKRSYTILYTLEPDGGLGPALDKSLPPPNAFYLQTSLLYTNERRQRMLRVHNYMVPVSNSLSEVYSAIDFQSLVAALVRKNITQYVSTRPLPDIQQDVIAQFKKVFTGIAAQTPQSVQEELLSYLALGFLGILKHIVFQAHYINNC